MNDKAVQVDNINIHQRIAAVMAKVSYVQKDKEVKSGDRILYKVVSHDNVIRVIRPFLVEQGIVTTTKVTHHERIGQNMTVISGEVHYINKDNPEDREIVPMIGYGIDSQDKGPGKAISYLTRFAHLKTFALETGDDPEDGNDDFKEEFIGESQIIVLTEICDSKGFPPDRTLARLAKKFDVEKIEELPMSKFDEVSGFLSEQPANQ